MVRKVWPKRQEGDREFFFIEFEKKYSKFDKKIKGEQLGKYDHGK